MKSLRMNNSGSEPLYAILMYFLLLLKKHKTKIIWVEVFFVDDHTLGVISPDSTQTYSFNNAIIATGSRLIEIKGFKFGGHVLDSMGA